VYYTIPVKGLNGDSDLPWLLLELVIFGAIVGVQVPLISRARYPLLRGLESLALTVLLFLLIFARVYLSNSAGDPAVFTQPLDRDTALYFTVTVFATVGFGDITASSGPARLVVSLQMMLDLVLIGFAVRAIFGVARNRMEQRSDDDA
jgi:uncharacterized membrane protein